MEPPYHRLSELFGQLGLATEEAGIRRFITEQAPLPGEVRLEDAPFWNAQQARLLCELIVQDADWAHAVDQLNEALRAA